MISLFAGCPSIRSKALSRDKNPVRCVSTALFASLVEDQSLVIHASSSFGGHYAPPTIDTAINYGP
jgi:hypothetical protein